ncbi:MAG: M6 family metalloprotease domain-containing protein [Lachnospiraceae bacterium]|nr:M6 family metalloprotease domain-containing protein [Lachnospiraceae bacterium]
MRRLLKRYIAFCMVLLMTILSFHIDALAADQYKGGIVIEDDTPKVVEEGLMPSTGDVKAAVLMVEFQDVKASVTKDSVRNTMFGESNSMNSYYKTSSYGKLNVSGDVYDWYEAPYNREYYEDNTREYPPNEYLFRDVIAAMDSQVDFSQYDSDNDGYVDMVYLVYAGEDEGYQSLWWAYMDELLADVEVDGKKITQYVIMPENFGYLTAAHETGHAMGLQDYYDTVQNMYGGQAYYGTNTLMCTSDGDLDVLSKWMLGWLQPQIVTQDKSISLRPSNEYPDAAVIKSKVAGGEDVFFIAEYRTATNNNANLINGGVSVFRVNAKIDSETGTYKYDVSSDEVRLIENVAIDVTDGYVMGTTKEPTSYIVQENDGNVKYSPTGITVDNVSIGANVASMDVAYQSITANYNLSCKKVVTLADSRILYTLVFPVGVNYVGGDLIATDGISEVPTRVARDNYSDSLNKNEYHIYSMEAVKPNTTYTIDIPAGAFMAFDGSLSKAEKLQVTTSPYGNDKEYLKPFGDNALVSDCLPFENGGFVYFTNESGSIYMKTVDASGNSGSKLLYTMKNYTSNGVIWYWSIVVQACQLEDGSYVVTARDQSNNAIVKVTADGRVVYSNEMTLAENTCLSAIGNEALIGINTEGKFVKLTQNNQIMVLTNCDIPTNINAPLVQLEDKYAVLADMSTGVYIFDSNLKLVTNMPTQNFYTGVDIVNGNLVTFEGQYDADNEITSRYACIYDAKGNLIERGLIGSFGSNQAGYGNTYVCDYGYVFVGEKTITLDTGDGFATGSPIGHIVVTDKNYKVLYEYSMDYNGTGNGDSITSVAELNNETIVVSTAWCDYVLKAPTKADQHSHSYGNDNVCDICGYTKLANEGGSSSITIQPGVVPSVNVYYRTHIQTYGWEGEAGKISTWKKNGEMSGTSGKSKRLEGIEIEVASAEAGKDVDLGIQYTTHCQSYGWLPWSVSGEMSGTSGEAKRLEAIKIQLTGADADKYDVYYRVHAQSYGWLGWAKNGEPSGTAGYGKRLEGIQIVVVKKGESLNEKMGGITSKKTEAYVAKSGSSPVLGQASTDALNPVINGADAPYVMYKTHVQSFGWQKWVYNGTMSGTSGKSKRLEGINIKLSNAPYEGDIVYTTHVQKYGWKDGKPDADQSNWKKNGEMSGTSGEAKRLEAICINLTGEMAEHYDVYYRVHAQTFGWLGWAKNGEESGTAGYAKRLEGIQIVLVEKGGEAPGKTYGGITSKDARAYIEKK